MSPKIPPQFEGHESKVRELVSYLRWGKLFFYFTFMTMAVNIILSYGLIFHRPWMANAQTCGSYCARMHSERSIDVSAMVPSISVGAIPTTALAVRDVSEMSPGMSA